MFCLITFYSGESNLKDKSSDSCGRNPLPLQGEVEAIINHSLISKLYLLRLTCLTAIEIITSFNEREFVSNDIHVRKITFSFQELESRLCRFFFVMPSSSLKC